MTEALPASGRIDRQDLQGVIHKLGSAFNDAADPDPQRRHRSLVDRGELAQLRRSRDDLDDLTFIRLAVEVLEPGSVLKADAAGPDLVRAWRAILQGMALMAGLHRKNQDLGAALALHVSEARVSRLLRARGDRLLDQVRSVAHLLRSKGQLLDWTDLAELVLTREPQRAERIRRRLAVNYYRNLQKKQAQPSDDAAPGAA